MYVGVYWSCVVMYVCVLELCCDVCVCTGTVLWCICVYWSCVVMYVCVLELCCDVCVCTGAVL